KLLLGLKHEVLAGSGTAVVNTADDENFFGLHVSPDLDTVIYTLSGLSDEVRGWGVRDDTFHALEMLGRLGCEMWFKLGDRDLATHIYRTMRLRAGATLTQVTAEIAERLGAGWTILPMTDDRVRTWIETPRGFIPFQEYFVKNMASDRILSIQYRGVESAAPTPQVVRALTEAKSIIICPSNPIASIGPILSLPGVRDIIKKSDAKVLAVSPIVGGRALKGPAAKMMAELGIDPSPAGVAGIYRDFLDVMVMDSVDISYKSEIMAMGVKVVVTNTVMSSLAHKRALARTCLEAVGLYAQGRSNTC
ncbi:MAG: 2-phospho-L-lactate transferase, partial [Nitrososphaerota archaeon]